MFPIEFEPYAKITAALDMHMYNFGSSDGAG